MWDDGGGGISDLTPTTDIYLIRENPGDIPAYYKVGMSKDPRRRLTAIQTAMPKAKLIAIWRNAGPHEKAVIGGLKKSCLPSSSLDSDGDPRGDRIEWIGGEVFALPEATNDCVISHSGTGGSDVDSHVAELIEDILEDL